MSRPPKTNFMALIADEVAPAARPPEPETADTTVTTPPSEPESVVTLKPRERVAPSRRPVGQTLKERAHQLSIYLEPPVYDRLRDIAHEERTKLHPLILEAIDLLLKKRGSPSIRELTRKAG
jgi:hypothetical protein